MAEIKISCSHCSQHIQCDESYGGQQIKCPSCSQPLLIPQILKAEPLPAATPVSPATPILGVKRRQKPDYLAEAKAWDWDEAGNPHPEEIPALWNPTAATNWSLCLLPFGAFLHARNAETLGRTEEANTNKKWFYILLANEIVFTIAYFLWQLSKDGLVRDDWIQFSGVIYGYGLIAAIALLVALIFLGSWYSFAGSNQVGYVKNTYGKDYERKKWGKPLLVLFGYRFVVGLIASVIVFAIAGQKTDVAGLESQVKADIQTKLAQDPATSSTKIQNFRLIHESGNKYKGMLEVQTDGNNETADVDVTYDGRTFMWKILPQTTPQNSKADKLALADQVYDPKTGRTKYVNRETGQTIDPAIGLPVMPSDLEWNKDNDDPLASGNYKIAWNKLEAESNLKSLAKETGINDVAVMAKSPKDYIGEIYGISGVVYWVDRKNDLTTIKAFWLDENKNKTDIWYMTPNTYDGFHNGDLVNFYGYFVGKGMGNESIMLVGNKAVLLQKSAQ
jgi:hypothetical protein